MTYMYTYRCKYVAKNCYPFINKNKMALYAPVWRLASTYIEIKIMRIVIIKVIQFTSLCLNTLYVKIKILG